MAAPSTRYEEGTPPRVRKPREARIASPAQLRASRVGLLFLTFAIVIFGYGYFGDEWIKRTTTVAGTDYQLYLGLWRSKTQSDVNDVTTITIVPLDRVSPQPPRFGDYETAAANTRGLGGTALALMLLAWLVALLVVFSIGPHAIDLFSLIVAGLGLVFAVVTIVVYEGKRPKGSGDTAHWDDYDIWRDEGLVIAGTCGLFIACVLFLLGKR
jgi:hypothetical protein